MTTLKPCPFCGGPASYSNPERLYECESSLMFVEIISCDNCMAEVSSVHDDDIITAWNTRSDIIPDHRAKLEVAEEMVRFASIIAALKIPDHQDDVPITGSDGEYITCGDVREARVVLKKWRKAND